MYQTDDKLSTLKMILDQKYQFLFYFLLIICGSFSFDCSKFCGENRQNCVKKCTEFFANCNNCTCEEFCDVNNLEDSCQNICDQYNFVERNLRKSDFYGSPFNCDRSFYKDMQVGPCTCSEHCMSWAKYNDVNIFYKKSICCFEFCHYYDSLYTRDDYDDFYNNCYDTDLMASPNNPIVCLESGKCSCNDTCDFLEIGQCCLDNCAETRSNIMEFVNTMYYNCFISEADFSDCLVVGSCSCLEACSLMFADWGYYCCEEYCNINYNSSILNYGSMMSYYYDCTYDYKDIVPEHCLSDGDCSCEEACRYSGLGNCCYKYCIESNYTRNFIALKDFSMTCSETYDYDYSISCLYPGDCSCEETCWFFNLNDTDCCSSYCNNVTGKTNIYDLFEYHYSCKKDMEDMYNNTQMENYSNENQRNSSELDPVNLLYTTNNDNNSEMEYFSNGTYHHPIEMDPNMPLEKENSASLMKYEILIYVLLSLFILEWHFPIYFHTFFDYITLF